MDLVVSHFSGFLSAVALTGHSFNETVLTKCLHKHFKCGPTQCKLFAQKMSAALIWCREISKSVRSGSKTNEGVLQVVRAIQSGKGQASSSPSPSPSLSPAPATPPKRHEPLGDDAASAYQHLQDVFGGALPSSAKPMNAIPSVMSLCDSPAISVASSMGSPQAACPIAKQVHLMLTYLLNSS